MAVMLLGCTNIHKIMEQSQKHRFQNADIQKIPNPGPIKFRHRLQYLEPGICKSLDYYCHLTTATYYFHLAQYWDTDSIYSSETLHSRMQNGILQNVKNGVHTLSQFLTGYEKYVYVGDHSFMCSDKWNFCWHSASTDIKPKLICMVSWLSGTRYHLARNYPHLWHARLN